MEVKMSDLDEALKHALSLDVRDRAALAERLLASLEDLPEEDADCLWAEEAQGAWTLTEKAAPERFELKKFTRRQKDSFGDTHQVPRGSRGRVVGSDRLP
jgi:hypothetical protein